MKTNKLKQNSMFQWGIAQKFILCIVLFSFLMIFILSGIQLYIGYNKGLESIKKNIRQIEGSYLPGIIDSLWGFNYDFLKIQLNGMMKLDDVLYIDVVNDDETLAEVGVFAEEDVIVKEFPLLRADGDEMILLGRLRLVFTLKNLRNGLMENAISIIISQSILLFLVSGFMFIVFYLLVARHLYALVNYTKSLGVTTLETPFSLKRYKRSWGKDEFDILADTVNEMRMNLNDSYSHLKGEIFLKNSSSSPRNWKPSAPLPVGLPMILTISCTLLLDLLKCSRKIFPGKAVSRKVLCKFSRRP